MGFNSGILANSCWNIICSGSPTNQGVHSGCREYVEVDATVHLLLQDLAASSSDTTVSPLPPADVFDKICTGKWRKQALPVVMNSSSTRCRFLKEAPFRRSFGDVSHLERAGNPSAKNDASPLLQRSLDRTNHPLLVIAVQMVDAERSLLCCDWAKSIPPQPPFFLSVHSFCDSLTRNLFFDAVTHCFTSAKASDILKRNCSLLPLPQFFNRPSWPNLISTILLIS